MNNKYTGRQIDHWTDLLKDPFQIPENVLDDLMHELPDAVARSEAIALLSDSQLTYLAKHSPLLNRCPDILPLKAIDNLIKTLGSKVTGISYHNCPCPLCKRIREKQSGK